MAPRPLKVLEIPDICLCRCPESGISQNDVISPGEAASYGLATNQNHGVYRRGLPYDVAAKLRVASALRRTTSNINVSATARECGVSTWFVRKIRDEMIANGGGVVDPRTLKQGRVYGPGVKTFDEVDQTVLLYLYIEQPYRSNSSYADNLYAITGTVASPSTISRWFNHGFPISEGSENPILFRWISSSRRIFGGQRSTCTLWNGLLHIDCVLEMRS